MLEAPTYDFSTPTVKIACADHPAGYVLINRSEFNSELHKVFVEKPAGK